jgi:hypothetical protein
MARQRRGGFRPPEIRGTLGTLLRTTLAQAGVVRDALGRSAREGRSRLDEALSGRRRKDALADLGALVLDLIRRGEIDLGELPEAQDLVRILDDLDADSPPEEDDRIAQPPTRGRFDSRARGDDRVRAHDDADDDGTVSATRRDSGSATRRGTGSSSPDGAPGRWSPPKPSAPQRVWRPSLADDAAASESPDPRDSREPRGARDSREPRDSRGAREPRDQRSARPLPVDPLRKGGIQFDDDEDLADYMHPDDIPPKPPSDGDR